MTLVQDQVDATGDASHPALVAGLGEDLARLMSVVHALKARLLHRRSPDLERERAAHALLYPLVRLGPQRLGALAELVHVDPSTVSRHVGVLVRRGLVRRDAEQGDGRASRLVVTPDGAAVLEAMQRERDHVLEQVTLGWSRADLHTFCTLLHRFVHDVDAYPPARAAAGTAPSKKDL